MSKQSLIVSSVVGGATLVVHGMFLCLGSEPAEAQPRPAEVAAAPARITPERPTLEASRPSAAESTAPAQALPAQLPPRSSTPRAASPAKTSPPVAGPARPYRVSSTLTSDRKVAKLIAIQADLDGLSQDIAMLGRLKNSLGAEKVERLALRSTTTFLRLGEREAKTFEQAAKTLLEDFRRAAVTRSRARRAALAEARRTKTSPQARLREIHARFARDLQAAARGVRPLLRESQRAKVFNDQLGRWAEHLITTLR